MSAEPNERPANRKIDLVTEFREEYAKAMLDVQVSAEHTATEGWQRLFRSERESEQSESRRLCKSLEAAAMQLQLIGPTEDSEKEIGDIKKSMTALRERREGFDSRVVAPVKEPVEAAQRVIDSFRSQARRQEQDAPLHNVGLEHLMNDEISKVSKACWVDETGRVEVQSA